MNDLIQLFSTIPGVENVRLKENTGSRARYLFRYQGVKFGTATTRSTAWLDMSLHFKAKLFSNGKMEAAFRDWAIRLYPECKEWKDRFIVVHASDIHNFSMPLNKVDGRTGQMLLRAFISQFPGVMEKFSKDGKVELDYDK